MKPQLVNKQELTDRFCLDTSSTHNPLKEHSAKSSSCLDIQSIQSTSSRKFFTNLGAVNFQHVIVSYFNLDGKDNGFGLNKRYLYFIVHFSNIGKVCSG